MNVTLRETGGQTASLSIVNPIARQKVETAEMVRHPAAPRLDTLEGKIIGFFWNGKQQGNQALERTKANLKKLYPDVQFRDYLGAMGGVLRRASDEQLDAMARECDAVVGTSADCGSCTSWLIHDMCGIEQRGTPAIAWTAKQFHEDAHWSANVWGVPDLVISEVPECFTNNSPDRIHAMVDAAMDQIIRGFTETPTTATLDFKRINRESVDERELSYDGADLMEAFDAMQSAFVRAGWSDGFPLVPPTPAKVARMVEASGKPGDHVLGLLEPGFGLATVEKIAANAVMAGCTPAMMPLLLAIVDAFLDYRAGFRGVCMSTGPQAPVILVSGPVVDELGLNCGIASIGPGSQNAANVAIGRAARLFMMNIGLSYPGVSDMDTHGTTMKFSYCVAENQARNPWAPYRMVKGYAEDESTVTINSPFSQTCLYDFQNQDAELLAETFGSAMSSAANAMGAAWLTTHKGADNLPAVWRGDPDNLLILCPDHAQVFHRAGWSLETLREKLYHYSRLPFRKAMLNKTPELFKTVHPHLQWMWEQPDTEISLYGAPESFDIFVTGGDAGWSTWHDGGTYSVTRRVGDI
ncbi:UGSC family (seleno)protein [Tropicimonas isoalkanivorans]|uniref:UGSC-like domain-containing protein n=1 Tax=Tropicimonas isoalkanivorans TaxID=441112 RepID=A0A1I1I0B6_9RHOB|nr:hypothetical protein [Tropicimonas isoalkanivorans]SFC29644.1 hypothetical protein SAMN04488094_103349 [Tropicimonas isoalkanivorans]